jgi:hypothetical protein
MKWLLLTLITSVYAEKYVDPCGRTFEQAVKDKAICVNPNFRGSGIVHRIDWADDGGFAYTAMDISPSDFLTTYTLASPIDSEELMLEDNL